MFSDIPQLMLAKSSKMFWTLSIFLMMNQTSMRPMNWEKFWRTITRRPCFRYLIFWSNFWINFWDNFVTVLGRFWDNFEDLNELRVKCWRTITLIFGPIFGTNSWNNSWCNSLDNSLDNSWDNYRDNYRDNSWDKYSGQILGTIFGTN